jgi:heterotetrameric sarcosine oxidase delta subunit
MRINCPLCGERDSREFHYRGSAKLLNRPAGDAGDAAFHDYVYVRDNTAGVNDDLWFHDNGCGSWLVVARNVSTHEITSVTLAADIKRGGK